MLGTLLLNNLLNSSMGAGCAKGHFSFFDSKNFLKNLHPSTLTATISCFSSYHHLKLSYMSFVYLVTACLPLYQKWNLLSQCLLYHLKLSLVPGKGAELLEEGRKGGKNIGRKVFIEHLLYALCI